MKIFCNIIHLILQLIFIGGIARCKIFITNFTPIEFQFIDSKSCRINSRLLNFSFYGKILFEGHRSWRFFSLFKLIGTICYPGSLPLTFHKTGFKFQGSFRSFPMIVRNFQYCQIFGKGSQLRSFINKPGLSLKHFHPVIHRQNCLFQ